MNYKFKVLSLFLIILYSILFYKRITFSNNNIILLFAVIFFYLSSDIEKFTTSFDHSDDLVHNLSSVYNDGKLIVNNLEVLDKLNVKGSTAFLNSDTTIDGDITFKSGYLKVGEEYFEDYVKKE